MDSHTEVPAVKTVQPRNGANGRKLFSTGEWLTLLGMVAAVMSASQPWQKFVPPAATTFPAAYVTRASHLVAGFDLKMGPLPIGWVVVAAATICGALLLGSPSAGSRRLYLLLQSALSALILALACFYAGPFAGIYLAAGGALLLLSGGVLRYR